MDVTSTFLNGVLSESVYMCQPKGFEEPGKEDWVWKLKKALYSLKQGGHEWYHFIDNFLTKTLGLTCTFANHLVYVYETKNSIIFIPLYVDDLLISYHNKHEMEHIKSALESQFKMVDTGPAAWVLGMCITNDPSARHITLDQSQYILKVVEKFGMADCKPAPTPLPEKTILCAATDEEAHNAHSYPYLQVLGSVMYVMLGTRPDIAYAVSTLSCFASQPRTPHVQALKHLLQYVQGSATYGIIYSRDGGSLMGCGITSKDNMHGFTNSDYAMDPDTHCSISGAVFLLAGGLISWSF